MLWLLLLEQAFASVGAPFRLFKDAKKFYGCKAQISSEAMFCPKSTSYRCFCSNKNYLATVAGCLNSVGPSDEATNGVILYCADRGFNLSDVWFNNSLRTYKKRAKTAAQIRNFKRTSVIHVPLILNSSEIQNYQNTYSLYYSNFDNSLYYGFACVGYWVLVLFIAGVVHWTKRLFPGAVKLWTDPVTNVWRRHVTAPAMFRRKRTEQQNIFSTAAYLIPSRAESVVILLFYVVVSAVHLFNAGSVPNERKYHSQLLSRLRIASDRAAIVSIIMMPLMFLFAGRNNFLQWLVGLPYSTFVAYHRHIARIIFGLILTHGVGFSILFGKFYSRVMQEPYIRWGITSMTAGGIIMVQSMLYLRRRWYEVFLMVHVVLALFWTVGTLFHVKARGYIMFVFPSVGIWIVDRTVRLGKLVSFGFPVAEVSLFSDETLRVCVPKPSYWKPIPGGHAFIHFLRPSCFWQSHPFTFVESPDSTSIVFYCKIKGGATHGLYQWLDKLPGKAVKMRVAVEGPYGRDTNAKYADMAVFIAAGNGIPGLYSEVMHIAKKDEDQKLKLIWVVREWKSLIWFYDELLQLKKTRIETTIYVTKPETDTAVYGDNEKLVDLGETKNDLEKLVQEIKLKLRHVSFKHGRPVLKDLVREQVECSKGSVAFVACASHGMVDEIRYYCAKNISNQQKKRVDFYEQIQVWA
ncbi:putative ferric reductase transmembrane component [Candida viswanathii]|uniref:ferric-chelate reductase (NADPH) n=1 Tax=Candida viswanathii TaxID=5486 RepID=A0A367YDR1_9ASCO|nr:putative ferric reductase transmembrane component [Candida viswanathii]